MTIRSERPSLVNKSGREGFVSSNLSLREMGSEEENGVFYLRYHIGHKGKHGHEFLEFEFTDNGKLRYANNPNYKNNTIIRKEVYVSYLLPLFTNPVVWF